MKKLLLISLLLCASRLFAAPGACPSGTYSIQGNSGTLSYLGVTIGCYYVSSSIGSDSLYDGTQETVSGSHGPFANAPGMHNCASNCASVSLSAGTGIILRGGDTWTAASFGWLWTPSGSSSHPYYLGVDQSWYNSGCGASWCRPIFNLGGSAASGSYYIFLNSGSTPIWTTVDDFEETGWSCSASESGTLNTMISPDAEYEHMYVHGWSYNFPDTTCQVYPFGANASDGTSQVANSWAHYNVIDGSDQSPAPYTGGTSINCSTTAGCVPMGCVLHMQTFSNNVCNFVYNVNGLFNDIHGNLFENFVTGNSGDHCNMTNVQSTFSGSVGIAYNNIYANTYCGGGLVLWLQGNSCSATSTWLAWGNIFYKDEAGSNQLITTTTHPTQGSPCGNFYIFNNIGVSTGNQQIAGNGESAQRAQVYLANNFMIGSSITLCLSTGVYCFDEGNELTLTAANADSNTTPYFNQYSGSQSPYVYAPAASTNQTVGAGQNVNSNINNWCPANNPLSLTCPTISFTGIYAAALSDTTYASENTSNHTVVLRTSNSRGSTWDIGAYQYVAAATTTTSSMQGVTAQGATIQ